MSVLNLDNKNINAAISSGISLVDFYADWCGPCKMLAPTVRDIADIRPNVTVGKINVDDSPELAAKYGIVSIPTLIIFRDGKIVDRIIGVRPREHILASIDKL